MPTAAVTAVLNDDLTRVLLMWRHRFVPDLWNWELPGGLVDEGEEPAQTAAREVWNLALKRSGLPTTLRFHDLRHSYATWLISDGVPVDAVQKVMGHANASTTLDRYTHAPRDYEALVRGVFETSADDPLTFPGSDHPDDEDEGGATLPLPA
jgi:integrase